MARVTVEDCLNIVHDRFELVLLAGKRAREIAMTVGDRHDKDDVLALKEIGTGYLDINDLRQRFLYSVHNIPYFSKEESDEMEDIELYEGYEANPVEFFSIQSGNGESTTSENSEYEEDEGDKLRIDDQAI